MTGDYYDEKADVWIGITDNYVKVKIKKNREINLHNQMLPVKLLSIAGQGFIGEFKS